MRQLTDTVAPVAAVAPNTICPTGTAKLLTMDMHLLLLLPLQLVECLLSGWS